MGQEILDHFWKPSNSKEIPRTVKIEKTLHGANES